MTAVVVAADRHLRHPIVDFVAVRIAELVPAQVLDVEVALVLKEAVVLVA